jgi:hypothetical protein
MSIEVPIRGESGSSILIEVNGYEYPGETEDPDDSNWLLSRVSVRVVGFTASLAPTLRTEDFTRFLADIEHLAGPELGGSAVFDTEERQIEFKLEMAKQGACTIDGRIRDHNLGGDLHFRFQTDQSYLAETIQRLHAVVREYPVRGQP